ncbi:MAG: hypothetical protein ACR2PT_06035 [Endozoicomonas sp.]
MNDIADILNGADDQQLSLISGLEGQFIQAMSCKEKADIEAALKTLITDSEKAIATHGESAELLSIFASAKAELANVWSNPKSIPLLSESKKALDKAIELKPLALDGLAEATLAGLFYFAPGKPFSFGNKKQGIKIFEDSLEELPESLELQFQYANLLVAARKKDRARELYQSALKAIDAPAQQRRDAFKQARKAAIEAALAKLG